MFGFIGALQVEVENLIGRLENDNVMETGMYAFHQGKLYGKDVVVAKCGPGKINAALCTQSMIVNYHPEWILNLGVAGSGEDGVSIGDMVVATCAVQHDCDTTPLGDKRGLINKLNITELPCDESLRQMIVKAAEMSGDIVLHQGIIATGDQFISTAEKRREIHSIFGNKAVEMEGGAVAQACYMNGTPCGILRSISDNADGESSIAYPAFLKIAAAHSQEVVEKLLCHVAK